MYHFRVNVIVNFVVNLAVFSSSIFSWDFFSYCDQCSLVRCSWQDAAQLWLEASEFIINELEELLEIFHRTDFSSASANSAYSLLVSKERFSPLESFSNAFPKFVNVAVSDTEEVLEELVLLKRLFWQLICLISWPKLITGSEPLCIFPVFSSLSLLEGSMSYFWRSVRPRESQKLMLDSVLISEVDKPQMLQQVY